MDLSNLGSTVERKRNYSKKVQFATEAQVIGYADSYSYSSETENNEPVPALNSPSSLSAELETVDSPSSDLVLDDSWLVEDKNIVKRMQSLESLCKATHVIS